MRHKAHPKGGHGVAGIAIIVLAGLMLAGLLPLAAQTPVGSEFRANTFTYASQYDPQVAHDGLGNFVVVWASRTQDLDGYGIYGQRYDGAGAPLEAEFQVNTTTSGDQREPAVACAPSGEFVVAWESGGDVYARRYDSAGNPVDTEFRVNAVTTEMQQTPDVSMAWDGTGGFVITWASWQNGVNFDIYAQQYDAAGAPVGSAFRVNSVTTDDQSGAAVSHDLLGNFVVVWTSFGQDGSFGGIYGQRYNSAGTPLGGEFLVNSYTAGAQSYPGVDHEGDGNFVVVWMSLDQEGESWGVYGQRYDALGSPLGSEFRVNTTTAGSQKNPAVAGDPEGGFFVVWGGSTIPEDEASMETYGQLFDEAGLPSGSEFRVNTYTDNSQRPDPSSRSVSLGPGGGLVVVWQSLNQDSSGWGIYGQRLAQTVGVTGTVFSDCGGPMAGITVGMTVGEDYQTVATAEDGSYRFSDLRYLSEIELTCVLPMGFHAVSPVDGHTSLTVTQDEVVNFELDCVDATGAARGMGYWKHQATVYLKGKGHAQESEEDMRTNFPNAIFNHFHEHELYGIPVEGVTYMGDPHVPLDLATIYATLTVHGGLNLPARAKQHYLALMLNMASGRIRTYTVVSADGRTASEVVQYVADLINDGDACNDWLAMLISVALNEAYLLPGDVVPEGYVTVYYRRPLGPDQPLSFSPNPVGLGSVISFGMPVAGRAELVLFDVTGRKVASLLSGEVEAGTVRLQWLGRADTGERLPKGIYSARLTTPQGVKTARVVQLGE